MQEEVKKEITINAPNSELPSNEQTSEEKKRFRDYLFFFGGQQISILGSSIVSFALIWWITETTQSELMLGIASLVALGPYLFIVPFAGVIADRANKKMLLLVFDSLQALFTVGLTIIFMVFYDPNTNDYTNLLLTCVFITLGLRGSMQAFHEPVVSILVPTMVPQKRLSQMNGVNYLVGGIIRVIGPALGAIFLSVLGVSLTLWADAITFLFALVPILLIKFPEIAKEKEPAEKRESSKFFAEFAEGLKTIKAIRGMFALLLMAAVINFFFSPISTLLPMFVNKIHGGNEDNYALVVGILQVGVIVGGLFTVIFKGFKNPIRTAIICVVFMFTVMSTLIVIPTTVAWRFWMIGIIMFLGIVTNPTANVSLATTMQTIIPKDKLGRVSSVLGFISMAISPLGNFLSGVIGEYVPIGWVFTVSALIGLSLVIIIYFLTPAKDLDSVLKKKIAEMKKEEGDEAEKVLDELDEALIIERKDEEGVVQFNEGLTQSKAGKP